ncbi:cholesterol 24-hydroxylase-like [Asterias rubens]|uniref:cholesterol 24-hydroxylase-like n=1 Tax=Asterias rubens TaxID=7604 RepID=UPI00145547AA|nr:cholesterol 24-hydroxylase-like [Asterias rubens]XP_033640081.1 cholesterol 24-hydroxylase-like [Asterias rubens]XP_033640110.1 cholesterol 24-hydroxylase-like [Asterias rubens]
MASISELLVMTFGSVFLVCLIAFVASVLFLHYRHSKYSHIPGPKRRSFFLGNIQDVREYVEKDKLIEDAVNDWGDQFGDVIVFWFLHQCIVYFFDVQAIKEILVTGSLKYPKGWTYDGVSTIYGARFLGHGLVTEQDHTLWAKRRDIFNPAFSRSYLKTCISQFNASSDLLVEHLSASADGKKNVHLLDQLNKATIDIIAKVAFGANFHQFDPEKITSFNEEFNIALKGMKTQFESPWNKYNPSKTQRDYRAKVRHAIGVLRETGQKIIASQLSALGRGEQLGNNILAFILEASQASSSGALDMDEMVDEFTTFFLAGQETTANLLASTMIQLCQNPEAMYRLKTEVDAVVSTKEFIPYEDLSKLEYMVAVLKETLRLRPPAAGTVRITTSDCVISNTKIPASTILGISFYASGRNGKYWENPLEFIPDRFLHGNESTSGAFTPFSIGPRNCIGQQFALIEARVLLAKLIQHYNFSLVPGQSLGYTVETTMKPVDGCQVYLTPASSNQQ